MAGTPGRLLRAFWLAPLLAALVLPGCATIEEQTATARDDISEWTKNLRPRGDGKNPFFHSDSRANEIERNLGVR